MSQPELTWLLDRGDAAPLHLDADDVVDLLGGAAAAARASGTTVTAHVDQVAGTTVENPADVTALKVTASAKAAAGAPRAHRVGIAIVTNVGPLYSSRQDLLNRFARADAYWRTQSEGRISELTIAGIKEYATALPVTPRLCSERYWEMQREAQALFPDFDIWNKPDHIIIVAPMGCTDAFSGSASVGGGIDSGGAITLIDYGGFYGTLNHELGHNLGLLHFGATSPMYSSEASWSEYGNPYEVMGSGGGTDERPSPALGPLARNVLGISAPNELVDFGVGDGSCAVSRTYELSPVSSFAGTRAIRFGAEEAPAGFGKPFYLSYRDGLSADAGASYASVENFYYGAGVVLEESGRHNVADSALHPVSANTNRLRAGEAVISRGRYTVTLHALGPSARVSIYYDPATGCGDLAPTEPPMPTPPSYVDPTGSRIWVKTSGRTVGQPIAVTVEFYTPEWKRATPPSEQFTIEWFKGREHVGSGNNWVPDRKLAGKLVSARVRYTAQFPAAGGTRTWETAASSDTLFLRAKPADKKNTGKTARKKNVRKDGSRKGTKAKGKKAKGKSRSGRKGDRPGGTAKHRNGATGSR